MSWYAHTIDTVACDPPEKTETDRLWRQIDPVVQYKVEQVRSEVDPITPH